LFWHDFYQGLVENAAVSLDIVGVDISDRALNLARENKAIQLRNLLRTGHNDSSQLQALQQMQFLKADVLHNTISHTPSLMQALSTHTQVTNPKFDILISNPPYISSRTYSRTTSPSVRSWEPKLALVPPSSRNKSTDGDIFYPPLLRAAAALEAQVMLLEVADMEQAIRVAAMVVEQDRWACVQIWRDGPNGAEEVDVGVRGKKVSVFGTGNGRSVFAHRGKGRDWSG
jgi:methylase of polypeptide subunit release factors